jgi:ribonucleoside-triphosphate reductase (formate)
LLRKPGCHMVRGGEISVRAQIITRRTYNRPLDESGTRFETWEQTIDRVIGHQRRLWEEARGSSLGADQAEELEELRRLYLSRKSLPAGRTLWMGGTDLVWGSPSRRARPASNYNCCFVQIRTVHDIVDAFWLLLQGAGVGFKPVKGTLFGFVRPMDVEVIPSTRTDRGPDANIETWDADDRVWTIRVGDSAEAWAKAVGKIVAGKYPARKIVLDFTQLRPAGVRLRGYGWISSGWEPLSRALVAVCGVMNRRSGKQLSRVDLWDIINWLGTVLSTRRSAQCGLIDHGDPEWRAIATRKPPGFAADPALQYRSQSNNSLLFHERPSRKQLRDIFSMMVANGGAEPGFVNVEECRRRAPWFEGFNPCFEINLADKGVCNLCENNIAGYDDDGRLHRALWLNARANYRQTCVDLRDGILQDAWHQTNENLRLCGVGICGVTRRPDLADFDFKMLRNTAVAGAYSMADELGTPRPQNVSCLKPGGTTPKIMDTTESCYMPVGEYIFNDVNFSRHDPLLPRLMDAGYYVYDHPTDPTGLLARLPVSYRGVDPSSLAESETAIAQLERYRRLQRSYSDQNTSITVYYDPGETDGMTDWFMDHWDAYSACAFAFRQRTEDGESQAEMIRQFGYLPQRVVSESEFVAYEARLAPLDLDGLVGVDADSFVVDQDCFTGACPAR